MLRKSPGSNALAAFFFLYSLLMVVPSSLANMERLKDGNAELCRFLVEN